MIHHEGISAQLFTAAPPNMRSFEQIATTFPECRVIFVVREQRKLLMSWYRHNVRLGLGVALEDYLKEIEPGITPYFRFDIFEFDKIVLFLQTLFGKNNVLILPYELLKYDRDSYIDKIYEFCSVKKKGFLPSYSGVNVGLSPIETLMFKWVNRLFVTGIPIPHPVTKLKKEEVDFCWRAKKAGWQVWYVPQSKVFHLEGASTGIKTKAKRRASYWYDSRRRFFIKHYGIGGLLLADSLWAIGRISFLIRLKIGLVGKNIDADPKWFMLDLCGGDIKAILNGNASNINSSK